MPAICPEAAATNQDLIEAAGNADCQAPHARAERALVFCFDQQMQVIGLHRVVHYAKTGRGALVQRAKHDARDVLAAQGVRARAQCDMHWVTRSVLCPRAMRRVPRRCRQALSAGPIARAAASALAAEFKPQLLQVTTPPATQYLAQTRDLASVESTFLARVGMRIALGCAI